MEGLGRVNLLVGANNCGKTSVLEAISMLLTPGSVTQVWNAMLRRGEVQEDTAEREFDLAHLFHGHRLDVGQEFKLVGHSEDGDKSLSAAVVERDSSKPLSSRYRRVQRELFDVEAENDTAVTQRPLSLRLCWSRSNRDVELPITRRGGLLIDEYEYRVVADSGIPVHLITTDGLARDRVVAMLEGVVLTELEDTVLEALRSIEPNIERIAPIGSQRTRNYSARGGIAVRVNAQRIPIGSMGDGIWRLLGVALGLVRAQGGALLVDEIDTGLHYTVLQKMWKLVHETATKLDVQVFATTHSRDCYEALSAITEINRRDVSLQRIERDKPKAVAFTEEEIAEASQRGLEVR